MPGSHEELAGPYSSSYSHGALAVSSVPEEDLQAVKRLKRVKSQEKRCEEVACLEIYLHGIQVLLYIDMISSSSSTKNSRSISYAAIVTGLN